GRFEEEDVRRARSLAKAFPDAVLAFVTLRDELGKGEKKRLIKLLKELPDFNTEYQGVHRPMLVLTRTELHHHLSLSTSWENSKGRVGAYGKSGVLGHWHGDLLD